MAQINVGDRFEDQDPRQGNRVIRLTAVGNFGVKYKVEVADLNPKTVGRRGRMLIRTLIERYRKVSR